MRKCSLERKLLLLLEVLGFFLLLRDRCKRRQDHVRDNLWLRHHDHVRALGLGDRSPRALGHRTDGIGAHHFVAVSWPSPVGYWSGIKVGVTTESFELLAIAPRVSPSSGAKAAT